MRVNSAREKLIRATSGLSAEAASRVLRQAIAELDEKLRPLDIVGKAQDPNFKRWANELIGPLAHKNAALGGAMYSAAAETASLISRQGDVLLSSASGGKPRHATEMLSAVESTAAASGSTNAQALAQVVAKHGARVVVRDREIVEGEPPITAQVDGVDDWYTTAMKAVVFDSTGKPSCEHLRCDITEVWEKVYFGEAGNKTAAAAAQQNLDEVASTATKLAERYINTGDEMRLAIALAAARWQAVIQDQSDHEIAEAKRRVAVIITATQLNMELTALAYVEFAIHTGKPSYHPPGGDDDLVFGFGPELPVADKSSIYERNNLGELVREVVESNDNSKWTRAVWRTALERCAYPNISDTFEAMAAASRDVQKHMLNPPDITASNTEVRLMQVAYWAAAVSQAADKESRGLVDFGVLLDSFTWLMRIGEVPGPRLVLEAVDRVAPLRRELAGYEQNRRPVFRGYIRQWSIRWREAGYARVDVSHKLAAALMLTDVGDEIELRAPWRAFSVHVPPGITRVSRICVAVPSDQSIEPLFVIFEDGSLGEFNENHLELAELDLLRNFVRGVCLAVEQGHAKREGNHGTQGAGKQKRFAKAPPAGERYQLAAPVKIDLREVVREHLGGKHKGGSPKVQFVVRGHWRDQTHGPQRSLRKRIWIEPFWKGPEEARVLLRAHHVEGEAGDVRR
jgi:hypothetical protein